MAEAYERPKSRTFPDGSGYLQCPACGYADVPSEFIEYVPPFADSRPTFFYGLIQCHQCDCIDTEKAFIEEYADGSQVVPEIWFRGLDGK